MSQNTTEITHHGGCRCESVRYTLQAEPLAAGFCHCKSCQKLTGTGHAAMLATPQDAFSVNGETTVYTHKADSGNTIHRHFCPTCGTTLYALNEGMPGMAMIAAGTLDDPEVFQPQLTVYAPHAPSWDHVDPDHPSFPGMPPQEAMPSE